MSASGRNAVQRCLDRGHHPYVLVGDPDGNDEDEGIDMQVIGIRGDLCVHCIDEQANIKTIKESWLLAFGCELCDKIEKTNRETG